MGQLSDGPIDRNLLRKYKKEYREFLRNFKPSTKMTQDQKLKAFLLRIKKDKPAEFWKDLRSSIVEG